MGVGLWCTTQVHPSGPRHSVCQLLGGLAPVTHSIILLWEFPLTEGVALPKFTSSPWGQVYVQDWLMPWYRDLTPLLQSEKGPCSFRAPLGDQLRANTSVWKSNFSFCPILPLPSLLYRSHSFLCFPINLPGVNSISEFIAREPTYTGKLMSWG